MKWILQMGTVQSNRQKLENGNTAWVFLLECNFCSINFLKVEMETASIKSTNYFGAVLSDISRLFPLHVAFLSFTCILETVVNHSENASGLHFSPVKVYVHCRIHNTHIYWCFKKQILKISPPPHPTPGGTSWPKTTGAFEEKCTLKDYFYSIVLYPIAHSDDHSGEMRKDASEAQGWFGIEYAKPEPIDREGNTKYLWDTSDVSAVVNRCLSASVTRDANTSPVWTC